MKTPGLMDRSTVVPFFWVACAWFALSLGVVARFPGPSLGYGIGSLALLWGMCVLDLYSLSRAMAVLLELSTTTGERRGALTVQAFYWGMIKLICLGILGMILYYGRSIPTASLLTGTGTLVVVPLVGGYWWSQKVLSHAS